MRGDQGGGTRESCTASSTHGFRWACTRSAEQLFYCCRHNATAACRGPSIAYFDTTLDMRSIPSDVYPYQPDLEVAQELDSKDWFHWISYSFVLGLGRLQSSFRKCAFALFPTLISPWLTCYLLSLSLYMAARESISLHLKLGPPWQ